MVAMKALILFTVIQVLRVLQANPIVKNITKFNDADEEGDLSWRLPRAIYPISYYIELETKVHDEGNREYSGKVIIHLDVREATNEIILHAKELNIKEVLLFSGMATIDEIMYYEDDARDFLIIATRENFVPGSDLSVMIEFSGQLQLEGVGFYRFEYKIDGETRYLATTQFEASYCRHAFPVFDGIYDNFNEI
jgi:aminopeptidase 2